VVWQEDPQVGKGGVLRRRLGGGVGGPADACWLVGGGVVGGGGGDMREVVPWEGSEKGAIWMKICNQEKAWSFACLHVELRTCWVSKRGTLFLLEPSATKQEHA
jgi:hypothetical protein